MRPDPYLLERLMCEVALMRHHVAYGVPPAWDRTRVCRNNHTIVVPWEQTSSGSCLVCQRIARVRCDQRKRPVSELRGVA